MGVTHYQILDVGLRLESSQGPALARFHEDYRRFAVPGLAAAPRLVVRFELGGAAPYLEVDGAREDLAGHPRPELHATRVIAQALMDRVAGFTVLHAAVVGSKAGALALAGPPGAGKTTTTLALLAAGWSYLSDDFCPLDRATGLVHPFPRSLWVRPSPGAEARNQDQEKLLFPLDGEGFRIEDRPMRLRWLFCLDAGEEPGRPQFRISLRQGREAPVLAELEALEGCRMERPGGAGSLEWLVRYPGLPGQTEAARAILARHEASIWNVYTLQGAAPDFSGPPRLTPLAPAEAAFRLMRELKQGLAGPDPKPGALLAQLAILLAPVACYRLSPGPLDKRLALIQDTVLGSSSS